VCTSIFFSLRFARRFVASPSNVHLAAALVLGEGTYRKLGLLRAWFYAHTAAALIVATVLGCAS